MGVLNKTIDDKTCKMHISFYIINFKAEKVCIRLSIMII